MLAERDFDRDGLLEIVVGLSAGDGSHSFVGLLRPSFDGSLVRQPDVWSGTDINGRPPFVRVADMNKDGEKDIVALRQNPSSLIVALGRGNGRFGVPSQLDLLAHGERLIPRDMLTGDFSGEGKEDAAVATNGKVYLLRAARN